jgi:hypothetical protein
LTDERRKSRKGDGLGETIVRHWMWIVLLVLALALGLAIFHGIAEAYLHRQETTAQIVHAGDPAAGQPSIQAWIGHTPLEAGEPFKIWLRVQNPTRRTFQVRLEPLHLTPALRARDSRWAEVRGAWGGHKLPWNQATFDLAPESQKVVWTEIVPVRGAGSVTVTPALTVSTAGDSSASWTWVLPLRELRIISPFWAYSARVLQSFITLIGVLVLPTAGGLLAFVFQHRQQRNVQERQDRQQQIDRKLAVWSKMIPTSHENNVKYYIPLASAIQTLAVHLEAFRKARKEDPSKAEEHWQRVFFFLLFVHRRYRLIVDEGAGFYLQTRDGESLVYKLYGRYQNARRTFLQPEKEVQLDALVDLMDETETQSRYLAKLPGATRNRRLYETLSGELRTWLETDEGERAVAWTQLSSSVLMFEVNQIYDFWYGSRPEAPDFEDLRKKIPQVPPGSRDGKLLENLRKYCLVAQELAKRPLSAAGSEGFQAQDAPPVSP